MLIDLYARTTNEPRGAFAFAREYREPRHPGRRRHLKLQSLPYHAEYISQGAL